MKKQIEQFLIKENISPSRFADELGIQRSSISHILSGRNNPGYELIIKILTKYSHINPEWLLTGNGNMYKETINTNISEADITLMPNKNSAKSDKSNDESEVTGVINNLKDRVTNVTRGSVLEKGDSIKNLNKVLFFYSDGTFEQYNPTK